MILKVEYFEDVTLLKMVRKKASCTVTFISVFVRLKKFAFSQKPMFSWFSNENELVWTGENKT